MLYRYPPTPLRFGLRHRSRSCSETRIRRAYVSEPAQASSVRHFSKTGEKVATGLSHSTDKLVLKFRLGRNSSSKSLSTEDPFSQVVRVGDRINIITGS